MRRTALALVCVVVAAAVAAPTATARTGTLIVATTGPTTPLPTGLSDPVFQRSQAPTAYAMARRAGATYARLVVHWGAIAPVTLPVSGFVPTDPASPYYRWTALDATVAAANAAGLTPILDIVSPPHWGFSVPRGTWTGGSPKIPALGAFATAIAAHYDGSGPAPTAHIFSVWNEPNYNKNLSPQDASYYRAMVNAVAEGVHGVDPSNLVLAGELAPFKHTPSTRDRNNAIPPLTWMRNMLCISSTTPVHLTCDKKAEFDVWTHHPYSDTGPFGKAKSSGGVELGDLPKMNALLQTAQRLGAIVSAKPVQFWVTEVGWSSNPPNTNGVPILLEARWVAETMYQMWRSNVTLGTWFLLEDLPKNSPFQSGLYFRAPSLATAQAKVLLTPFRFPFVAYLRSGGKVQVWGRDATSNQQVVTIQKQERSGGVWANVATITSNNYGIFEATLPLTTSAYAWVRASAPGSGRSRPFSLSVPRNENLIVEPFPLN